MEEKNDNEYSDGDEIENEKDTKSAVNVGITRDIVRFKYYTTQYKQLDKCQEIIDEKNEVSAHITLAVAQFVKSHGYNPHVFFNANWMVKLYLAFNERPKEQHKIFTFVCAYICMKLEKQEGKIEPSLLGYFNDFVKPDDYIFLELDIMRSLGDLLVFPNEYTALDLLLNTLNANHLRDNSVLFLMMSTMMKRTPPVLYYVFASVWLANNAQTANLNLDEYIDIMKYDKNKMIAAAAKIMYILVVLCKKSAQNPDFSFLIPITADYIVPLFTPIREACQAIDSPNAKKIVMIIDEYLPTLENQKSQNNS